MTIDPTLDVELAREAYARQAGRRGPVGMYATAAEAGAIERLRRDFPDTLERTIAAERRHRRAMQRTADAKRRAGQAAQARADRIAARDGVAGTYSDFGGAR